MSRYTPPTARRLSFSVQRRDVPVRPYFDRNYHKRQRVFGVQKERCQCARRCLPRKRVRAKAQRDGRKVLLWFLCTKLGLEESVWSDKLLALIAYLEGVPSKHLKPSPREIDALCARISGHIDYAFDEPARFNRCEREPTQPYLTAVFDHTFIPLDLKDPDPQHKLYNDFLSGKHKAHGVKFLCTVTMQGTFIACEGPFYGAMHDFACCKLIPTLNPLRGLIYESDCFQADLGYQGSNDDVVILPHRKPVLKMMPREKSLSNSLFAITRSRVEHSFGNLKRRFGLFSSPIQRDPYNRNFDLDRIGILFKLACLIQSHHTHLGNRAAPKYATCINRFWRDHSGIKIPDIVQYPPKGDVVHYSCFPNPNLQATNNC